MVTASANARTARPPVPAATAQVQEKPWRVPSSGKVYAGKEEMEGVFVVTLKAPSASLQAFNLAAMAERHTNAVAPASMTNHLRSSGHSWTMVTVRAELTPNNK